MKTRRLLLLLAALALACGDAEPESSGPLAPDEAEPEPSAPLALDEAEIQRLAELGYTDWSEPASAESLARTGVTLSDPARFYAGYNLYTSLPTREARLLDMRGAVVHRWADPDPERTPWNHVEMTDQGALFALGGGSLEKLDFDSRHLWEAPIRAHHDLDVAPDGTLYALARRLRRVGPERLPIIDDEIVVLDPDGSVVRRIALSKLLPGAISAARLSRIAAFLRKSDLAEDDPTVVERTGSPLDVFHTNSIALLPRDVAGLGRAGDALISMRTQSRIAVVDLGQERIRWSWGPGQLDHPHHATLLPDDEVSVFDNGWFRGASRVLRVSPARRITWQYPEVPGPDFFTRRRGAAQHLPNGNVLITESQNGRVFEIAPDGEMVWEFLNPEVDAASRRRAGIYRMERLEPARIEPLLRNR